MHRTICLSLIIATVALTGCSTASPTSRADAHGGSAIVSLATLGPASGRDVFFFGAGDALGQEIFTYYVASLRTEQHYATGEVEFIE